MTYKQIERIERFAAWCNKEGLHLSINAHRAPIGKLKASGKYLVELNYMETENYYTAKPKDQRLNITYFD